MKALIVSTGRVLSPDELLRVQEQLYVTIEDNFPFGDFDHVRFMYERPDKNEHPLPKPPR